MDAPEWGKDLRISTDDDGHRTHRQRLTTSLKRPGCRPGGDGPAEPAPA